MMKTLVLVFLAILSGSSLLAQQNPEIKGTGSDLYLDHVVVAKESFYSVGRMYNITPKVIAAYNHLKLENGLRIGQEVKIPLDANNFTQTGAVAGNEVLVPVIHKVVPGETLFRLGVNYNKVALSSLKTWNHLSADELKVGQPIIVGYLKVDKNQSSLAARKAINVVSVAVAPKETKVEVATSTPAQLTVTPTPTETPAVKEVEAVTSSNPTTTTAQTKESKITVASVNTKSNINFSGGYFRNLYNQQGQNKNRVENPGSAGVFKSTSGWQDGKYYCFYNEVAPGNIIKVSNNATGKMIYAKVLDAIPDIKQNVGLSVVISNAAAEELGAGEVKFDCIVSYAK